MCGACNASVQDEPILESSGKAKDLMYSEVAAWRTVYIRVYIYIYVCVYFKKAYS